MPRWNTSPSTAAWPTTSRSPSGEQVEPRLQECVDRRWDEKLRLALALSDHRDHLLHVEGVPLGCGRDAPAQVLVEGRVTEQEVDQCFALGGFERLEQERRRVELAPAPVRLHVQELGPRDAEEKDRCVAREVRNVLDQIDEHGLRPLEVVDHDDLRSLRGAGFEQATKGDPRLLGRGGDDAVGLDADSPENLDERPVGDPLAVGQAAAAQDVRGVEALEEVCDETRLPDPGGAEKREQTARAIRHGVLVVAPEALPLTLTPDEGGLGVAGERRSVGDDLEEPERLDRLGLSLQRERLDRLDADGVAHEHARLGADQRLAGSSRLLEARGDVHGISRDERLSLPAHDDLAGVDPDPRLERRAAAIASRISDGGPNRAQRVVLVGRRNPEHGHDRVADELLHGAAVPLDDRAEISKYRRMRARSASGSVDSPRAVDPTTSQKRIVTTLRCSRTMARSLRADGLQLGELDVRGDRGGDLGVEAPGTDLANGRRSGGDGESDRLVRLRARRGPRRGTGRAERRPIPHAISPPRGARTPAADASSSRSGEARSSRSERDQDVPRAHLRDRVERHEEVVVVLELLPDELLGLALVRRDEEGCRFDADSHRLALAVEHDPNLAAHELADGVGVERGRDLARERACEDDEVGSPGEVLQLLRRGSRARRA